MNKWPSHLKMVDDPANAGTAICLRQSMAKPNCDPTDRLMPCSLCGEQVRVPSDVPDRVRKICTECFIDFIKAGGEQ